MRTALRGASLLLLSLVLFACDELQDPDTEALFLIRACPNSTQTPGGETFRVLLRNPAVIAEAEALVGKGATKVLTGRLAAGDGGFNQPWRWHLHPDSVGFADAAIELCDGCPSFVEGDLDYWLNTVRFYCPWSAEVMAKER